MLSEREVDVGEGEKTAGVEVSAEEAAVICRTGRMVVAAAAAVAMAAAAEDHCWVGVDLYVDVDADMSAFGVLFPSYISRARGVAVAEAAAAAAENHC